MPHRSPFIPLSSRRQSWLALLVLALLWAQLLGLAHHVRHAVPGGQALHTEAAGVAQASVLDHLQAPAGDEADCRLYDQLGHGSHTPAALATTVALLPQLVAWVLLGALPPGPCAGYGARAPPATR